MRTRSRSSGSFSQVNVINQWKRSGDNCSNSLDPIDSIYSLTGEVTEKTVVDNCTANFQELKRKGGFLPLNQFSVSETKTVRIPGSVSISWTNGHCTVAQSSGNYWTDSGVGMLLPNPPDTAATTYVVNAACAESRSSALDALTTLAELPETAAMCAGRMSQVFNIAEAAANKAKALARNKRKGMSYRGQVLDNFSNIWLEYRYGWMPLLYTIQDGVKALGNKLQKGDIANGTSSANETINGSDSWSVPAGDATINFSRTISGSRKYRSAAYSSVLNAGAAKYGADPLLTGWELITLSFVVDMFVDINSYLQAISPTSSASLLGACYSIKDEYTTTVNQNWVYGGSASGSISGISTVQSVKSYFRSGLVGPTVPLVYPRLTTPRVIDLSALIFGRMRSISRILKV